MFEYLNPGLNFSLHVNTMVLKSKVSHSWFEEFRNEYVTKTLFTTLVESILQYFSGIWNSSYQIDSDKLEFILTHFLPFL